MACGIRDVAEPRQAPALRSTLTNRPRNGASFQGVGSQPITTPSLVVYLFECSVSLALADALVKAYTSAADPVFQKMFGQCQTKGLPLCLLQLGLPEILVVGGLVLLRCGREPRAQKFDSTGRLYFSHLDDIKTSVTRRMGRLV